MHALQAALFAAWLALSTLAAAGPIAPLRVATGALPPFAITPEGNERGALVEVVERLARDCGQEIKTEFFPWKRAVVMPLNLPRIAVFPLTRTPEREAQYHWLVKLYVQQFVFVSLRSYGLDLKDTEHLKGKRIGVLRGSPHVEFLRGAGFPNVTESATTEELHRMLERHMIDVVFGSSAINLATLDGMKRDAAHYVLSAPLTSGDIWLGGSRDFKPEDHACLQAAMKQIEASGDYAHILKKYGLTP